MGIDLDLLAVRSAVMVVLAGDVTVTPLALFPNILKAMYNTEGVDAIATITELRADTSELIDHVRNTKNGILIQKNNEPYAVLMDWEVYKKVKDRVDLASVSKEVTG